MRQARILDVLRAVTATAAEHPEVQAWWYAPPVRLRLAGELARTGPEPLPLEIVVEAVPPASLDRAALSAALSRRLSGAPVAVRPHGGTAEARKLFRLLSAAGAAPEAQALT